MPSAKKLLSPVRIGNMELRNRTVMSPMTTQYANQDESVSDKLREYYVARSRGGVGLITVEVCTVDKPHRYQPLSVGLWDDSFISGHKELTKAIHAHGAKAVPQISHPGPESLAPFYYKVPSVGPSEVKSCMTQQVCRELSLEEIQTVIEQYGEAARRAREAGYDGMELHAAHSYMLAGSFLSPLRNKRTDAYNGSTLEGRLKFVLEVVRRMKAKAGEDFPLIIRISGDEREPGGRDVVDSQKMAPILVEAGVDAFHVSGGVIDRYTSEIIAGSSHPNGLNVPAAAAIKKVVNVPVMVVGRIHDPLYAEEILQKEEADLIVMGRPMLADPDLPRKVAEGSFEDIRQCISCQNCFDSLNDFEMMSCAVNAITGREDEYKMDKTAKPKKVMVVGAGPAGMEAARVAALRGHHVWLYDRQPLLGGSLMFATTVHPDNDPFLAYITTAVRKLPITRRLGTAVTPAIVEEAKPDAVIVAVGPELTTPRIPGDQQRNVFSAADFKQMLGGRLQGPAAAKLPIWQRLGLRLGMPIIRRFLTPARIRRLTRYWMPLGKNVTVIGGDLAASELALFVGERGRKVTLLTHEAKLAPEIGSKRRSEMLKHLDQAGVIVHKEAKCEGITPEGVTLVNKEGARETVRSDTVVIAGEVSPNLDLYHAIEEKVPEVYLAGDCRELGLIRKATANAMEVAHKI